MHWQPRHVGVVRRVNRSSKFANRPPPPQGAMGSSLYVFLRALAIGLHSCVVFSAHELFIGFANASGA